LKADTSPIRRAACSRRLVAAAADCSTRAEFCCVASSSPATDWLISAMPRPWVCEASLISSMIRVTLATASSNSCMVAPACATCCDPLPTWVTESVMSWRTSLAASAERWARLRTSAATTEKPRPCSPARAASTAAFSARILVWKAMESITPMMSAILRDEWLMPSMVITTCWKAAPPRSATPRADCASSPALRVASVLACTLSVSTDSDAAVCCKALAACSVRWLRSWLPWATSELATEIESAAWRTAPTMRSSDETKRLKAEASAPTSSLLSTGMRRLRSPWPSAISSSMRAARPTGAAIARLTSQITSRPMPPPTRPATAEVSAMVRRTPPSTWASGSSATTYRSSSGT
jgi:hypothetical protein